MENASAGCTYRKTSNSTEGGFLDGERRSVECDDTDGETIAVTPHVRVTISLPWYYCICWLVSKDRKEDGCAKPE
jgi:hypothetical protein